MNEMGYKKKLTITNFVIHDRNNSQNQLFAQEENKTIMFNFN